MQKGQGIDSLLGRLVEDDTDVLLRRRLQDSPKFRMVFLACLSFFEKSRLFDVISIQAKTHLPRSTVFECLATLESFKVIGKVQVNNGRLNHYTGKPDLNNKEFLNIILKIESLTDAVVVEK